MQRDGTWQAGADFGTLPGSLKCGRSAATATVGKPMRRQLK